jgi:hypothetical protein
MGTSASLRVLSVSSGSEDVAGGTPGVGRGVGRGSMGSISGVTGVGRMGSVSSSVGKLNSWVKPTVGRISTRLTLLSRMIRSPLRVKIKQQQHNKTITTAMMMVGMIQERFMQKPLS